MKNILNTLAIAGAIVSVGFLATGTSGSTKSCETNDDCPSTSTEMGVCVGSCEVRGVPQSPHWDKMDYDKCKHEAYIHTKKGKLDFKLNEGMCTTLPIMPTTTTKTPELPKH